MLADWLSRDGSAASVMRLSERAATSYIQISSCPAGTSLPSSGASLSKTSLRPAASRAGLALRRPVADERVTRTGGAPWEGSSQISRERSAAPSPSNAALL